MVDPTVTTTWSSGQVLTAATLNTNFQDIIDFFAEGGILVKHMTDKYATTCLTVNLGSLAAGATVTMMLDTELGVALTPTKLCIQTAAIVGGTLGLMVQEESDDMLSGDLEVGTVGVATTTSFIGGTVAGGSTLKFIFTHTGGTSSSNITACLWCKAELRA